MVFEDIQNDKAFFGRVESQIGCELPLGPGFIRVSPVNEIQVGLRFTLASGARGEGIREPSL
jgi:hypothetical protein